MSDRTELSNAVVIEAVIEKEDHGILTSHISLDYGGIRQGCGGYALDKYIKGRDTREPCDKLMAGYQSLFLGIWGCKLEGLKGKHVRALHAHDRVFAIGHIQEDVWLWFKAYFSTGKAIVYTMDNILSELGRTIWIEGMEMSAQPSIHRSWRGPEKVTDKMIAEARRRA